MDSPPSPDSNARSNSHTWGPLSTLAPHVPSDWWSELFGPTYLLTDSDVLTAFNTGEEVDRVLDLLDLSKDAFILDLCCGHGRHSIELAKRGFWNVQGLDQSAFLIQKARSDAMEEELEIRFQVGDCRSLPFPEDTFDAVLLMGNSFGYFPNPKEDRRVLAEVHRVLQPGGRILLDLACGSYLREHFERRSWEWLDDEHLVCREREMTEEGLRLVSREVLIHVRDGVLKDQFYAERLYDRSEISHALAATGFADVRFGGHQNTNSERDEDLGMMARRFWITASALTGAHVNGQLKPIPHIAVILGDPSLPDETKLGGHFDEDDFDVIEKVKAALASLDGYTFDYFDNHDTLIDDLRNRADGYNLALNFCDEGWRNNPRWELHISVLLEMLGIPYSGAGPQALAHCYDKSLVRGVAREIGVPVANGMFLFPGASPPHQLPFEYPVIVKPNLGDNSTGITCRSVARNTSELDVAVAHVRQQVGEHQSLLVEEFLPGEDLTFGLIGNPGSFIRIPITEDDYSELPAGFPHLCGFEAKWLPASPYWTQLRTVRATLDLEIKSTIQRDSERMFERLGCRDYARFDWRLDAYGKPRLLEVNPNPGWCWDGHLTQGAAFAGHAYPDVLRMILESALQRVHGTSVGLPE